jgi:Protein of unknown function (DUF3616)
MIAVMTFSYAKPLRSAVIGIAFAALAAVPVPASDGETWDVKPKIVGKDDKASKDVSGIACMTEEDLPRSCVVVDDNLQAAQFVTLKKGKIVGGEPVKVMDDTFKRKPIELDGEGVAFADGRYYIIGSHGHPRDKKRELHPVENADEIKARITASSQVIRFRPNKNHDAARDVERTPRLKEIIAADRDLKPYMDRRLDEDGLTIEGLAVRDGRLYAGFRAPVLDDNKSAAILSVEVDTLFGGTGTDHELFKLPLGTGRGVRDLTSFGDLILILAGPAKDGKGSYAVYSWDGKTDTVKLLSERKPEALLGLKRKGDELRVLILFDGDKNGAPTVIDVGRP